MLDYDLEKIIKSRKSIRSYIEKPLSKKDKDLINSWIDEIDFDNSIFNKKFNVKLLEVGIDAKNLGTYGVIKGAQNFLCITAKKEEGVMESIGFNFEKIILNSTANDLGTVWLAGTFKREQFKNLLDVKEDEIFPIVCPIGYASEKRNLKNNFFRKIAKSDKRKDFNEILFKEDFNTPLDINKIEEYKFPLEMFRLAPSSANRQLWKIIYKDNCFHFYRIINSKNNDGLEIERLDIGIALCHFDLAIKEKNLSGEFVKIDFIKTNNDKNLKYIISYKIK